MIKTLRPFGEQYQQIESSILEKAAQLPIEEKIMFIGKWLSESSRIKPKYMLYLIMYDIENNKIRTHIAKYLIKKGCLRMQKSVYLYKGTAGEIKEISNTLQEINEAYDNYDSIILIPVPQDKFQNMKMIGQNITFEVVTKPKNVLIF